MKYLLCLLSILLIKLPVYSQDKEFTILNAGEMNLDTDLVTDENYVKRYFGMYISGLGESIIRVSINDLAFERDYEVKVDPTKLTSFLGDDDLAEAININFRRGVFGTVLVSILNSEGELQDSRSITFDIKLKKSNCAKHPSPKLKSCSVVKLDKASNKLKKAFLKEFLSSIRGPIVLEP